MIVALPGFAQSGHAEWSENQLRALEALLEWVQDPERGAGRLPSRTAMTSDIFPFGFERLTGAGHYREAYPQHHLAIFSSMEDLWLNFRKFALGRGISVSLLNLPFRKPSGTLLAILQEEALELVFKWMQAHPGQIPDRKQFGLKSKNQIPVDYDRLTHTGMYTGGTPTSIFSSTHKFWRRQKEYCRQRGLIFHLIDVRLHGECDAETKAILQEEALDRIFNWIKQRGGQLPEVKNFGSRADQIAVKYQRLTGTSEYAPSGRLAHGALFADPQEFWLRLKAYAQAREFPIQLLNVTFSGELSPDLRAILQQEAGEIIFRWQEQYRRTPIKSDFGFGHGQIPLFYMRLVSIGQYSNEKREGMGIFSSLDELRKQYRRFDDNPAAASRIKLTSQSNTSAGTEKRATLKKALSAQAQRPMKANEAAASLSKPVVFQEPPSTSTLPEPKAEASRLEEKVLKLCLEWMRDPDRGNTRFPQPDDFGFKSDQIPFRFDQLVLSTKELDGKALFLSFQDFALKLKMYAQQHNYQVNLIYVPMHSPLTPVMRKVIQRESLAMIHRAMVRMDVNRLPTREDFRRSGGPIRLDYDRLIGSGIYLYNTRKGSRVFDSKEEFENAYLSYVDEIRSSERLSLGCSSLLSDEVPES